METSKFFISFHHLCCDPNESKMNFCSFSDPIVKEQGRMASSNSPTPNALQGPVNAAE